MEAWTDSFASCARTSAWHVRMHCTCPEHTHPARTCMRAHTHAHFHAHTQAQAHAHCPDTAAVCWSRVAKRGVHRPAVPGTTHTVPIHYAHASTHNMCADKALAALRSLRTSDCNVEGVLAGFEDVVHTEVSPGGEGRKAEGQGVGTVQLLCGAGGRRPMLICCALMYANSHAPARFVRV